MKKNIFIIAQAYYGNRTGTKVGVKDIDRFILGYQDASLEITEEIDRTILPIPGTKCVLIYNKYEEEQRLKDKEEYFRKDGYVLEPLAFIPEENIEIYSRCIVCGITENGELTDVTPEDHKVFDYLAS